MRTDPRADEVRSIVERVFSGYFQERSPCGNGALPAWEGVPRQRLAWPAEDEDIDPFLPEIDESILIDQGRYVARTYRTEGYMAMWLVAVGIVQFYDEGGRMLTTVNLFASLRPQRMAA